MMDSMPYKEGAVYTVIDEAYAWLIVLSLMCVSSCILLFLLVIVKPKSHRVTPRGG